MLFFNFDYFFFVGKINIDIYVIHRIKTIQVKIQISKSVKMISFELLHYHFECFNFFFLVIRLPTIFNRLCLDITFKNFNPQIYMYSQKNS